MCRAERYEKIISGSGWRTNFKKQKMVQLSLLAKSYIVTLEFSSNIYENASFFTMKHPPYVSVNSCKNSDDSN
jgi:hypothetical protein